MLKCTFIFEIVTVAVSVLFISACQDDAAIRRQDEKLNRIIQKQREDDERRIAKLVEERKPTCQLMYGLYRRCYALGIQSSGDESKCVEVGVKVWEMSKDKLSGGGAEALAKVCALACKSSTDGDGLPSYSKFTEEWSWCRGK